MKKKHKHISGYIKVEPWMLKDFAEIEYEQTVREAEKYRKENEPKEKKEMKPTKEKKELHGSPHK